MKLTAFLSLLTDQIIGLSVDGHLSLMRSPADRWASAGVGAETVRTDVWYAPAGVSREPEELGPIAGSGRN